LFAVVTAAIANAFAIGVTLIAVVVVALVFIMAVARMRHGYPSTSHTQYHK
jgi:hypothetical protein